MYAEVAMILGESTTQTPWPLAEKASHRMSALLKDIRIAEGLKPYGVERKDLPLIAERAAGNARLIGNNPRPANAKLILEMLEASYN